MHYKGVVKRDIDRDRELVARAKEDPEAFGAIFDTYFDEIFRFALRRAGSAEVAEDIVAETFTKALRKLWQFRFKGIPLSAWLYRIAINEINMHYRRGKYAPASLEDLVAQGFDPADPTLAAEREKCESGMTDVRVKQALETLPKKYRETLALRYYSDMKTKDIAKVLGKREGTVRSLLSRGLSMLRRTIEEGERMQQNTAPSIDEDEGRQLSPARTRI